MGDDDPFRCAFALVGAHPHVDSQKNNDHCHADIVVETSVAFQGCANYQGGPEQRGSRVQSVVSELYDEKIDIVHWNPETGRFIAEALSPAKATGVKIDEQTKTALVTVPDNQLSLAIGKAGQNVRLAARLTGWRIDIRSETQLARGALVDVIEVAHVAEAESPAEDAPVPEVPADAGPPKASPKPPKTKRPRKPSAEP